VRDEIISAFLDIEALSGIGSISWKELFNAALIAVLRPFNLLADAVKRRVA